MKLKRSLIRYRGSQCLNCGRTLATDHKFCPNCGQLNSTKKLSFDDFFSEFFSGLFAYDSRFIRTMRVLLFKPGKISKDYIEGKRMRYVNPYRFFLTTAIVFFIIYGYNSPFDGINLSEERQQINSELQELNTTGSSDSEIERLTLSRIDSVLNADSQEKKTYKDDVISQKEVDSLPFGKAFLEKITLFNQYFKKTKNPVAAKAVTNLGLKNTMYNRWLYKKVIDFNLLGENPQLFLNYLIGKLPFIIFIFLPVFSLFLSLIYTRSKYNYMEHLTFAFHTQSMCFILYGTALFFDLISGHTYGITTAHIIFSLYLYQGLLKFYEQGKFKTLVKFVILNIIFFILALLVGLLSIFGSFAIF